MVFRGRENTIAAMATRMCKSVWRILLVFSEEGLGEQGPNDNIDIFFKHKQSDPKFEIGVSLTLLTMTGVEKKRFVFELEASLTAFTLPS